MAEGNPSLRVLILSWRDLDHPEAGGAEKYLHEIAYGLMGLGHRVTIRTAAYPGAVGDEIVDGVTFRRRGGHYSVYLRSLVAVLLGSGRYDVVVDVQNGVPFLSPLVTSRPVVNLVHHVHREQWPVVFGPLIATFGWWLESWVAPRVYARSRYVAVSRSTRRELADLGVDTARISLVHNGTDAVADPELAKAPHPTIVVLGRLVPQKQVDVALQAAARLRPRYPDLQVLVIGSGYWDSQLREDTRRLGLSDVVRFTGHVSEAEKHHLLARAWVLAVPSLKEGWGLVVVEAGVHGTPTVAFRGAGGLDESVRDGRTGILVDGGADEFAAALSTLLEDHALRSRMSVDAGTWARRFTWEDTTDRFARVLGLTGSPVQAISDAAPDRTREVPQEPS